MLQEEGIERNTRHCGFLPHKTVADLFGFSFDVLESTGGQFFKYVIYTFRSAAGDHIHWVCGRVQVHPVRMTSIRDFRTEAIAAVSIFMAINIRSTDVCTPRHKSAAWRSFGFNEIYHGRPIAGDVVVGMARQVAFVSPLSTVQPEPSSRLAV